MHNHNIEDMNKKINGIYKSNELNIGTVEEIKQHTHHLWISMHATSTSFIEEIDAHMMRNFRYRIGIDYIPLSIAFSPRSRVTGRGSFYAKILLKIPNAIRNYGTRPISKKFLEMSPYINVERAISIHNKHFN